MNSRKSKIIWGIIFGLVGLALILYVGILMYVNNQIANKVVPQVRSTFIKRAVFDDRKQWMKKYGDLKADKKNVNSEDLLNDMITDANRHGSLADLDEEDVTMPDSTYPESVDKIKGVTWINVPTLGTYSYSKARSYARTISHDIKEAKNGVVIDLRDNRGGLVEPMILGVSSLIPDGVLFSEVNSKNKTYDFKLKDKRVTNELSETYTSNYHKDNQLGSKRPNMKVAVLTNGDTSSAAEATLLSLRNSKKVKVFGTNTDGLTSSNTDDFYSGFGYQYAVVYPIAWWKDNSGHVYHNQPIKPDVKTASKNLQQKLDNYFK